MGGHQPWGYQRPTYAQRLCDNKRLILSQKCLHLLPILPSSNHFLLSSPAMTLAPPHNPPSCGKASLSAPVRCSLVGIDTEKIDECFDMESVRQTLLSGPPLQTDPPSNSRPPHASFEGGGRKGHGVTMATLVSICWDNFVFPGCSLLFSVAVNLDQCCHGPRSPHSPRRCLACYRCCTSCCPLQLEERCCPDSLLEPDWGVWLRSGGGFS